MRRYSFIIKINYFRGDLTGTSAKTKALAGMYDDENTVLVLAYASVKSPGELLLLSSNTYLSD